MYFNNSLFMLTHKQSKESFLLYVLGLMNSTLYRFLITQMTNLVDEGKYAYGAKEKIEKLPIPCIDSKQEAEFSKIVNEIIECKKSLRDSSPQSRPSNNLPCGNGTVALNQWGDGIKENGNSKICDEKCGLQEKSQRSYLSGNDCRDFSQLLHLSHKDELRLLESRLDSMVFSLYGLSNEEI